MISSRCRANPFVLPNTPTEYTYDPNGNMLTDANKGITSITYNHLNLPTQVFINNPQHIGNISYIYDASGVKLKKITTEGSSLITMEYAGNYIYENGTLQFLNHAEGYAEPTTAGAFAYVYQYKDHLGNIRLSYSDTNNDGVITATTEILEENNYYPFGLKHKGYNNAQNGRDHKYGFGNKEEQNELGLGWIDITARNYDAALGRWMNLDPLAEQYANNTPYNYVKNNPIYFVDPDGMKIELSDIFSSTENLISGIQLLLDLSEQTGLSLSVNSEDGLLNYEKDENGDALIAKGEDGQELGSSVERNFLTNAIDHKDTVKTEFNKSSNTGVPKEGDRNQIRLNPDFIDFQINNTSKNLNPKTLGYGMTFIHELFHTPVGGDLIDTADEFEQGDVVKMMNIIRIQLDTNPLTQNAPQSKQYGIRKYYMAAELSRVGGSKYHDLQTTLTSFSILNSKGKRRQASVKGKRFVKKG